MHVDTARSFLARSGRPHGHVAEPWNIASTEIRTAPPSVPFLTRLQQLVQRWMG